MIKLQPGDYVSTEGMTEEQYHAICKAFMDAGADKGEYRTGLTWNWYKYWGFTKYSKRVFAYDGSHPQFTRQLTIAQILGSDNTEGTKEMNLQEAYKVLQANCGIEVGDTVKVLRKAENYENGWGSCWNSKYMDAYIGNEFVVSELGDSKIRIDNGHNFPFFVLELVKKGKKLPDPIHISSQYQCEFKEDGSISVGGQSLDFELLEKIYMTAKEVKEKK